ncbi:alpha/beta-hydrolase, partial [Roridomyces roridus]
MSEAPSLEPQPVPYGTWPSPISASMISKLSASVEDILVDSVTSAIYYIEKRPEEGGRNVIVSLSEGVDVIGRDWNARTVVQEYGGAPAAVHRNVLVFSNLGDGQVYTTDLLARTSPTVVTNARACRFADFAYHPRLSNYVVCIAEDHTKPEPENIVTTLVCVNLAAGTDTPPGVLFSGADFYSSPRFNSDGTLLAWVEWEHPDMPWDGAQVCVAAVDGVNGSLGIASHKLPRTRIAGRPSAISAIQPTWLNHTTLVFSCDISGYQNPWIAAVHQQDAAYSVETRALFNDPVGMDFADPSWWLGESNICVLDESKLLFSASRDGRTVLYVVSTDGTRTQVESPFVHVSRMRRVGNLNVIFLASTVDKGMSLIRCSFTDGLTPTFTYLLPGGPPPLSASYISLPVPMTLAIPDVGQSDRDAQTLVHVVYYAPKSPLYKGRPGEKPPAIVNVHGGPSSVERQGLNLIKQFFTSRGWSWIDINYSGSSNYGREYMDRLKGNWGVYDVHDCVHAALTLSSSSHNLIDPKRIVIRGGSAGGYTTLSALSQTDPVLRAVFAAGVSSYGVSDLRKLAELTHKFQSHYVQTLVGGGFDEIPDVYRARSPVFNAGIIKAPLLILQGSIDPIVPPTQAEDMIKVIRDGGGSVEYSVFEGESHGWRKADTIARALELELDFYERSLGL